MIETFDSLLQASWRIAGAVGFLLLAILFALMIKALVAKLFERRRPSAKISTGDLNQLTELIAQSKTIDELQDLVRQELARRRQPESEEDEGDSVH